MGPAHYRTLLRRFGIELAAVTVGLFIALEVGNCVEYIHHRYIAKQVERAILGEIRGNLELLRHDQENPDKRRKAFDEMVTRIQLHPAEEQRDPNWPIYDNRTLSDTAWKAARNRGSLAYIPYEEVRNFERVYEHQATLVEWETRNLTAYLQLRGIARGYGMMPGNPVHLSAQQASTLAEELGKLGQDCVRGKVLYDEAIKMDAAFLDPQNRYRFFVDRFSPEDESYNPKIHNAE